MKSLVEKRAFFLDCTTLIMKSLVQKRAFLLDCKTDNEATSPKNILIGLNDSDNEVISPKRADLLDCTTLIMKSLVQKEQSYWTARL
jgi:hypothetical protein